jgi:hypothetical protein
MTSFFRSSARRIWSWPEACFLGLSIAAWACLLATPLSSYDDEAPMLEVASAEPALPLALLGANEPQSAAQPEPTASALPGEIRPQDQSPAASTTEPGPTASNPAPSLAPTPDPAMDEVNQYLWSVYERTTTKRDGTGDFTWKDIAAAARLGMSLGDYVIGGMDRDFRELLYRAGLAMDAAGVRWTILSAFRDDYRQGLASGYKALTGDSLHGGSATTGGYGHGCAIDIVDADAKSRVLWTWVDANSTQLGLERPLPGLDPAHVQPRGPWHEIAAALRNDRLAKAAPEAAAVAAPADLSTASPSDADMLCIGLHHHHYDPAQAITSTPPAVGSFKAAARAHSLPRILRGGEKSRPRADGRLAARTGSSVESRSASRTESVNSNSAKPAHRSKAAARSLARPAPRAIPHNTGSA